MAPTVADYLLELAFAARYKSLRRAEPADALVAATLAAAVTFPAASASAA